MNVPALRRTYLEFEEFVIARMREGRGSMFNDQAAYNEVYRVTGIEWTRVSIGSHIGGLTKAHPLFTFMGPS